jgi:hypothetical protein
MADHSVAARLRRQRIEIAVNVLEDWEAKMKKHTAKRKGLGLETRTFKGKRGDTYIVFRSTKGSYHAFVEVEAKKAAQDCGGKGANTRARWQSVWNAY